MRDRAACRRAALLLHLLGSTSSSTLTTSARVNRLGRSSAMGNAKMTVHPARARFESPQMRPRIRLAVSPPGLASTTTRSVYRSARHAPHPAPSIRPCHKCASPLVIPDGMGGRRGSAGRGIAARAAGCGPTDAARSSGRATMSPRHGRGLRRRDHRHRRSQRRALPRLGCATPRVGLQECGLTTSHRAGRGRSAVPAPVVPQGSMLPHAPSAAPPASADGPQARRSWRAERSARRKAPAARPVRRYAACRRREGGGGSAGPRGY